MSLSSVRRGSAGSTSSEISNSDMSDGHATYTEMSSMSGYLKKRSTWSSWKEVYVVVQAGLLLEFKKHSSSKVKHTSVLSDCTVDHAENFTNEPCTFSVTSKKSKTTTYWKCPDEMNLREWIHCLHFHTGEMEHDADMVCSVEDYMQSFGDAAVLAGQTGTIIAINAPVTQLLGWTKEDLVGQSVEKLMDAAIAKNHALFMARYVETGQKRLIGKPRVMEVVRKDGSKVRLELCLGEVPSWANSSGGAQIQFIAQMHTPKVSYDKESIDEMMDAVMYSTFQSAKMDLHSKIAEQMYAMAATIERLQKQELANDRSVAVRPGEEADEDEMSEDGSVSSVGSSAREQKEERVVEVMHMLHKGGGSGAQVYAARVDGWGCVMKAISIDAANNQQLLALSNEISVLESLPYHRNLVRYLFHRTLANRIEIFVTQYECTLADLIERRRSTEPHGAGIASCSSHSIQGSRSSSALQSVTTGGSSSSGAVGKGGPTRGNFSGGEICAFVMDIVRGIMTLHARKLIHRDLKPENIFVTFNASGGVEALAVGDFDTAKSVHGNKAAQHTVVGTPGYMAPEVLMNAKYSFPVDVFGVGMILYSLLSMQHPFEGEQNMFQVSQNIIAGKLPKIDDAMVEGEPVKKQLAKLYGKCVAVKPHKRPKLSAVKSSLVKMMVEC
eukprot:TRINITY_DN162_c0_g1_i5.p1 TRINITY_DN162_c0_g1~~TRINITY_DN162_c0_g1_i5.p1  ORF type:complete len:680 (+),score=238.76 TRINITY_DN162_c0_g1_i5:39-2042(+)